MAGEALSGTILLGGKQNFEWQKPGEQQRPLIQRSEVLGQVHQLKLNKFNIATTELNFN